MGNLYDKINDDLKQAMIKKDHKQVSVLKLLKSGILYAAVDSGSRDNISDEQVLAVLRKEAKKRQETADLYAKAGDKQREEHERYEKEITDQYLPDMLTEEQVAKLVDEVVDGLDDISLKMLGKVISEVKVRSNGLADGSMTARLAKERLSK